MSSIRGRVPWRRLTAIIGDRPINTSTSAAKGVRTRLLAAGPRRWHLLNTSADCAPLTPVQNVILGHFFAGEASAAAATIQCHTPQWHPEAREAARCASASPGWGRAAAAQRGSERAWPRNRHKIQPHSSAADALAAAAAPWPGSEGASAAWVQADRTGRRPCHKAPGAGGSQRAAQGRWAGARRKLGCCRRSKASGSRAAERGWRAAAAACAGRGARPERAAVLQRCHIHPLHAYTMSQHALQTPAARVYGSGE
jgi:hypothetical protein